MGAAGGTVGGSRGCRNPRAGVGGPARRTWGRDLPWRRLVERSAAVARTGTGGGPGWACCGWWLVDGRRRLPPLPRTPWWAIGSTSRSPTGTAISLASRSYGPVGKGGRRRIPAPPGCGAVPVLPRSRPAWRQYLRPSYPAGDKCAIALRIDRKITQCAISSTLRWRSMRRQGAEE
jgi:hypothetical protein